MTYELRHLNRWWYLKAIRPDGSFTQAGFTTKRVAKEAYESWQGFMGKGELKII